jgi:transposase
LLNELQYELWIGDAAAIRTKRVRKQKTNRQDAQLLLRLLLEDRFPRIWVPDAENRDPRQLLWHRHWLVQMRTRVINLLHVGALDEGLRRKKALWRAEGRVELEGLSGVLSQLRLETQTRRYLKCPRATRTKYLGHTAGGLPKSRIVQIATPAGEVRNVEQVKDLSDQIHSPAIVQLEIMAQA